MSAPGYLDPLMYWLVIQEDGHTGRRLVARYTGGSGAEADAAQLALDEAQRRWRQFHDRHVIIESWYARDLGYRLEKVRYGVDHDGTVWTIREDGVPHTIGSANRGDAEG